MGVKNLCVPVAVSSMPEIIGGYLDADGNFSGDALKEMRERLGIQINESELINLTELAYGQDFPGVYPSCGSCDEFSQIFLYRKVIDAATFAELNKKPTAEEGEPSKLY